VVAGDPRRRSRAQARTCETKAEPNRRRARRPRPAHRSPARRRRAARQCGSFWCLTPGSGSAAGSSQPEAPDANQLRTSAKRLTATRGDAYLASRLPAKRPPGRRDPVRRDPLTWSAANRWLLVVQRTAGGRRDSALGFAIAPWRSRHKTSDQRHTRDPTTSIRIRMSGTTGRRWSSSGRGGGPIGS
jgi:hypothetical protein